VLCVRVRGGEAKYARGKKNDAVRYLKKYKYHLLAVPRRHSRLNYRARS